MLRFSPYGGLRRFQNSKVNVHHTFTESQRASHIYRKSTCITHLPKVNVHHTFTESQRASHIYRWGCVWCKSGHEVATFPSEWGYHHRRSPPRPSANISAVRLCSPEAGHYPHGEGKPCGGHVPLRMEGKETHRLVGPEHMKVNPIPLQWILAVLHPGRGHVHRGVQPSTLNPKP